MFYNLFTSLKELEFATNHFKNSKEGLKYSVQEPTLERITVFYVFSILIIVGILSLTTAVHNKLYY